MPSIEGVNAAGFEGLAYGKGRMRAFVAAEGVPAAAGTAPVERSQRSRGVFAAEVEGVSATTTVERFAG